MQPLIQTRRDYLYFVLLRYHVKQLRNFFRDAPFANQFTVTINQLTEELHVYERQTFCKKRDQTRLL
jgi:hypothetical protein